MCPGADGTVQAGEARTQLREADATAKSDGRTPAAPAANVALNRNRHLLGFGAVGHMEAVRAQPPLPAEPASRLQRNAWRAAEKLVAPIGRLRREQRPAWERHHSNGLSP